MPPTYDGPRPEPASSGYASVTHAIQIDAPPHQVRDWNDSRSLADIVKFDGLPAVAETVPLIGDWVPGARAGNRRRVRFTDGNHLAEEVLDDSPDRFRYMIWGFTNAQRDVVEHGLAEFRFIARDGGTRLEWTYSFLPKAPELRPAV